MFPYILSGIGGALMAFLSNTGEDMTGTAWIVGLICAGIGIFMTIRHEETRQDQLMDLAFHAGAFIVGIIVIHLVAVVIGLVVLAIFLQFMGINVLGWVLGLLDGIGQDTKQEQDDEPFVYTPEIEEEEAPAPKVEVWRENGMMKEHLKVSSDGKRYYDPEDSEWHPIK